MTKDTEKPIIFKTENDFNIWKGGEKDGFLLGNPFFLQEVFEKLFIIGNIPYEIKTHKRINSLGKPYEEVIMSSKPFENLSFFDRQCFLYERTGFDLTDLLNYDKLESIGVNVKNKKRW